MDNLTKDKNPPHNSLTTSPCSSISPSTGDLMTGSGSGYLASEKGGYPSAGVYSSNYGCYYTNMDYLSPPGMPHSGLNVPVSNNISY